MFVVNWWTSLPSMRDLLIHIETETFEYTQQKVRLFAIQLMITEHRIHCHHAPRYIPPLTDLFEYHNRIDTPATPKNHAATDNACAPSNTITSTTSAQKNTTPDTKLHTHAHEIIPPTTTKLEPNMLKNLPIIPSRTSQNFYPLFFIPIAPPIILFYCVSDNITMQE